MNIQTTRPRTPAESLLIDSFADRMGDLPGDGEVVIARDAALEALKAHGLPSRRIESWHYTDFRTLLKGVAAFDPAAVNALLDELKATAEGFVRAGTDGAIRREITAFMRYVGQGWEIPVALPDRPFTEADIDLIRDSFRDNYARFFGRAIDGLDGLEIEIVTWSVKAEDERPAPDRLTLTTGRSKAEAPVTRAVFDPARGENLATAIVERTTLSPGARVSGPAVIVERETSTVVTSPFDVVMQDDGALLLLRKEIGA